MDARQRRFVETRRLHALEPLGVGLLRAERADVEAFGAQRALERRIVDLGIVGQKADRGVAVERRGVKRFVRPLRR